MVNIKKIMEKLEEDPSIITQDDYDEIEEITDNIMRFLDENPDIDRDSFMAGFTIANMNAVVNMVRCTTDELRSSSSFIPPRPPEGTKPYTYEYGEMKEDNDVAWPLRGKK